MRVAIDGASTPTYDLTAGDVGAAITVTVTGTLRGALPETRTSAATAPVLNKTAAAPTPAIAGTAKQGSTLTATTTGWTGELTLTYQWERSGVAISGATGATYRPGEEDIGRTLTVVVTGRAPGYTTVTRSMVTKRVIQARPQIGVVSRAHKQLTVIVRAIGQFPVNGKVVVRTPGGAEHTVTLRRGTATFTAPWVYAGKRTYYLEYLGSRNVRAGKVIREIVVR